MITLICGTKILKQQMNKQDKQIVSLSINIPFIFFGGKTLYRQKYGGYQKERGMCLILKPHP